MSYPPPPPPNDPNASGAANPGGGFGPPQNFGSPEQPGGYGYPQPNAPTMAGPPPGAPGGYPSPDAGGGGGGNGGKIAAIIIGVAVVVGGLIIGGVLLFGSDDDEKDSADDKKPDAPPTQQEEEQQQTPSEQPTAAPSTPPSSPSTDPTPTQREVQFVVLEPGTCFNHPQLSTGISQVEEVSCNGRHDGEVVSNDKLTGTFSSEIAIQQKALELCKKSAADAMRRVDNPADHYFFAIYPTLETYTKGNEDTTSCAIIRSSTPEGPDLTEPLP